MPRFTQKELSSHIIRYAAAFALLGMAALTGCTSETAASPTPTTTVMPASTDTPVPTNTPEPTATNTPALTATKPPAPTATARSNASAGVPPAVGYPAEIVRGDLNKPMIALTFDSGSVAGETSTILDILARNGVKSSWFITGQFAEKYPDLVRRVAKDGHEVFNHSYSHPDLTTLANEQIVAEMNKAEEILKGLTGVSSKPLMRMPFGARNPRVMQVVGDLGYRSVYWTLDSGDWREGWTPQMVQDRVLNNAANGYIVVHHSSPTTTSRSLDTIIRTLKERGMQVVKVTALIGQGGAAFRTGAPDEVPDGNDLLALVNKQKHLSADYVPADLQDLTAQGIPTLYQGLRARAIIVPHLSRMMAAAKADGIELVVLSGYRTYQEQQNIYQREVAALGQLQAERVVARPGHSQHQLGTTLDFTAKSVGFDLTEEFGEKPEGRWLLANAYRFGFAISYPKGKEDITGYAYEPWHYRFLGLDAAADLQRKGSTMEEYLAAAR